MEKNWVKKLTRVEAKELLVGSPSAKSKFMTHPPEKSRFKSLTGLLRTSRVGFSRLKNSRMWKRRIRTQQRGGIQVKQASGETPSEVFDVQKHGKKFTCHNRVKRSGGCQQTGNILCEIMYRKMFRENPQINIQVVSVLK